MNWVLISVIVIIVGNIIAGHHRGFLRMVYSLVSWIIVMAFVLYATPYINTYLVEHTHIYERIQEHCAEQVRSSAQKKADQKAAEISDTDSEDAGETLENTDSTANDMEKTLAELGVNLPGSVLDRITEKTGDAANEFLETSGIYDEIAKEITNFVVKGIAVILAIIAAQIVVQIISQLLGIISHIPVLSGVNRTLGIFAGGIYGLMIVWIAFYIIALCSTSEIGGMLVSYIYESRLLTYLYENNLVLTLIMSFL